MLKMKPKALATAQLALLLVAACGGGAAHELSGTVAVYEIEWWLDRHSAASAIVEAERELTVEEVLALSEDDFEALWLEAEARLVGTDCSSGVGSSFDDIRTGSRLQVKDAGGVIIAIAQLGQGTIAVVPTAPSDRGQLSACVFHFTVEEVPASDFYSLVVGSRDELTYSADELDELAWSVELRINLD